MCEIKCESATNTCTKLMKIDLHDEANLLSKDKVVVGVAGKSEMLKSKGSELQKMDFIMGCQKFMIATIEKLFERCPLKYKATRVVMPQYISDLLKSFHRRRENG
jgi:hypothetical protein